VCLVAIGVVTERGRERERQRQRQRRRCAPIVASNCSRALRRHVADHVDDHVNVCRARAPHFDTLAAMRLSSLVLVVVASLFACGPTLPPRYVVERDVGELAYRRYQHVLDVEMPLEGNAAEGHTATYLRRREGEQVGLATAFVTVYAQAPSLAEEIFDRLEELASYELSTVKVEGEWVWRLAGDEATWFLWVSGRHLVKLGVPALRELPEELAETYLDLYPSDLGENGRAREGTASAGASATRREEESSETEMPSSLREGAPR